jgi:biopolymer transport protein ExbD
MDGLRDKMRELVVAQKDKAINLRIRADGEAHYEQIAQVMAAARGTGVKRLGFITTPDISAADRASESAAEAAQGTEGANATSTEGATGVSAAAATPSDTASTATSTSAASSVTAPAATSTN